MEPVRVVDCGQLSIGRDKLMPRDLPPQTQHREQGSAVGPLPLEERRAPAGPICRPRASMLGEHMVELGLISEDELYEALSLQQSLPVADVDMTSVHPRVARALPAKASRDWQVLPFRVAGGRLDGQAARTSSTGTA